MTCGTCAHHWQRWQDALDHWINDWAADYEAAAYRDVRRFESIYREHSNVHREGFGGCKSCGLATAPGDPCVRCGAKR